MNRRKLVPVIFAIVTVILVISLLSRQQLASAYHQWRMNTAFESVFSGPPQPIGDDLAAWNVEAEDVDEALDTYAYHRQRLIDLGALCHIEQLFSSLASDGTIQSSEARRAFLDRMWQRFPNQRHYYLAENGAFEVWAPVNERTDWEHFVRSETEHHAN